MTQRDPVDLIILILKIVIFIIGQYLAYILEFGAVFFVLAALFVIWCNLGDSRNSKTKLSAYSVFNPNQQRIEGTVTPDKLLHPKIF